MRRTSPPTARARRAQHELQRTRAAFDEVASQHRRLTAQMITLAASSKDPRRFVGDELPWISDCLTALASDMDALVAEHADAARQVAMQVVLTQVVH